MAGKVSCCTTLFVICIVVIAATMSETVRADTLMDAYKSCFNKCHDTCESEGNGNTFCEMKCDTDCMAKETAAKLNPQRGG